MTNAAELTTGVRTLTAQDRADFERTQQALSEQLSRTQATPVQQVRIRLVLWIIRGLISSPSAADSLIARLSPCASKWCVRPRPDWLRALNLSVMWKAASLTPKRPDLKMLKEPETDFIASRSAYIADGFGRYQGSR